jgi:tetratricopeptide (TPR) repeat protein
VYLTRGESKKAEEVLSASIALDEKRDEEGGKDQMRRMRMLALAYSNRKEYAKALKYYTIVEEHLQPDGEDDPMLAAVLNQMGHMHRLLGRPDRAAREYEKQLAAVERYYGDQSIYYTGVLQNLAEAHAAMGDQEEAKAYLDQINKLCQRYGYSRNPWV